LQGIYDPTASVNGPKAKGNLQLSSWSYWSSSPGNPSGGVWYFVFLNGRRSSYPNGDSSGVRALCASHSGK